MKVLITAQGPELTSAVDPRFGRAQYFIVYDTESGQFTAHSNQENQNAMQGAGIQAGRRVSGLGAQALITGHVGPNAYSTLQAGNITVYTVESGTVAEAINAFKSGALKQADQADVQGHWK